MPADHEIHLQIGQLMGQMQALVETVKSLTNTMQKIEERLRLNETNTTKLSVKMSLIGLISGGVGSLALQILIKRFAN